MIDDIALRQRVLEELRWDPRIDATHVGITAADGVVTLTGHVATMPELFAIPSIVKGLAGVVAFANDVEVRLPEEHLRDDSDIAESIRHVLACNVSLPDQDIQAQVRKGIVTLSGHVDWEHQREHVRRQVAHVTGVRAIANTIQLRPHVEAGNVKHQIEAALARNAQLEAATVKVDVQGDEVTLTGNVRAFYERNLVEAACWRAAGVRKVTDRITVGS